MNKIGIQSAGLYDDSNYDEGMRIIKQAGFDCIDFDVDHMISYSKVCQGEINEFFAQSDEALKTHYSGQKQALEKYGLSFSQMHGPFPAYAAGNEAASAQLYNATVKSMMLCEYFDCPYLIVHPVHCDEREREFEINLRFFEGLIEPALKYSVGICLENMFSHKDGHVYEAVCSDIADTVEYIDRLNTVAGGEVFSFCYDLGHATLLGKNIRRSINMLGSRLTTLHIHDNDGIRDVHMQPYAYTRGDGYMTDWEGFLLGLRDIGYKGALSFETFNAERLIPDPLKPVMASYIAGVGKYFAQVISG